VIGALEIDKSACYAGATLPAESHGNRHTSARILTKDPVFRYVSDGLKIPPTPGQICKIS